MLLLLFFIVVGFFTARQILPPPHLYSFDYNFVSAYGIMAGFAVGAVVSMVIGSFVPMKEKLLWSISLASLRNSNLTEGGFLLGCGSIGSELCYVYYELMEDGGCVLRKAYAAQNDITVYEEDRVNGVFEKWDTFSTISQWLILVVPGERFYKFRIPKDSIKREFALS